MAEEEENADKPAKKTSKMPFLLGLVLAVAGGGGGFYAVYSGVLFGAESHAEDATEEDTPVVADMPDVTFVPVEPLIVSLSDRGSGTLRFRAQLEVRSQYKTEVERLLPRVVDVLNSYLRAVAIEDIRNSAALVRLRAQMLRRVQIVTGGDRVSDLLIMEFILN